MNPRIVEVQQGVLDKNQQLAEDLRRRFQAAQLPVFNLVSAPGSGKTAFLERSLTELKAQGWRPAALVGDLATDNDAQRLSRSGAPVRQIQTYSNCHLEAAMIAEHLAGWDFRELDILFIENIGNLVCPAAYDLGESYRVVLFSVTEGEDKPLKYPTLVNSADVAIITKIDLAAAVEFDGALMRRNLQAVRPAIPIFETSAKSGAGMATWLNFLVECKARFSQ